MSIRTPSLGLEFHLTKMTVPQSDFSKSGSPEFILGQLLGLKDLDFEIRQSLTDLALAA